MLLHADLSLRAVVNTADLPWVDSPTPGIQRKMIERDGDEVARCTSIVRYAPHSAFPTHLHGGGEEIFVLDGVFEDELGRYPAGTYIKNPPGSSHAPGSTMGCTLLVKLRHMRSSDSERVVKSTAEGVWHPGLVPGLSVMQLDSVETRHTALVRWAAGTQFQAHRHWGGEEIFVLDGVFEDELGTYPAGSWIRSPHLSQHNPRSTTGCLIFVKTGHLNVPAST